MGDLSACRDAKPLVVVSVKQDFAYNPARGSFVSGGLRLTVGPAALWANSQARGYGVAPWVPSRTRSHPVKLPWTRQVTGGQISEGPRSAQCRTLRDKANAAPRPKWYGKHNTIVVSGCRTHDSIEWRSYTEY